MCEADFRLMVSPYHDPAVRPPLIPNFVHAVERVRKWRAAGVKNVDDELWYLTNVARREIKRQGYTGKWRPRPSSIAWQLRRSYIVEMESRGWFKQLLYKIWPELF